MQPVLDLSIMSCPATMPLVCFKKFVLVFLSVISRVKRCSLFSGSCGWYKGQTSTKTEVSAIRSVCYRKFHRSIDPLPSISVLVNIIFIYRRPWILQEDILFAFLDNKQPVLYYLRYPELICNADLIQVG